MTSAEDRIAHRLFRGTTLLQPCNVLHIPASVNIQPFVRFKKENKHELYSQKPFLTA